MLSIVKRIYNRWHVSLIIIKFLSIFAYELRLVGHDKKLEFYLHSRCFWRLLF